MGRTRPLLQQIIMGVKINLAKWSDALLETSNCFSLILLPPPRAQLPMPLWWELMCHRHRGREPGGCSQGLQPIWCRLSSESWPRSWLPRFLPAPPSPGPTEGQVPSPRPPPSAAPGTSLFLRDLHQARPVAPAGRGGSLLHARGPPDPFPLAPGSPVPYTFDTAVTEADTECTDPHVQVTTRWRQRTQDIS